MKNLNECSWEELILWIFFLALLLGSSVAIMKVPGCIENLEREKTKRIIAALCIEHPSAPGCKENHNDD